MPRVLLALLFLPLVAVSAPVPKSVKAPATYMPTTVGTKWVYEARSGKSVIESTEDVTAVLEKDGVYALTVRRSVKHFQRSDVVYVSGSGLLTRPKVGCEPVPVFDPLRKVGDTWCVDGFDEWIKSDTTSYFTMGAEEEITVTAGTFRAIPVTEEVYSKGNRRCKITNWYAPGVGKVKVEDEDPSSFTQILKEFTPGKDAKK